MDNEEKKILEVLTALSRKGPIEAVGKGSNAVGKTLQHALGIKHSTTSRNSLYGYTITATTSRTSSSGRTNLFACVPHWEESNFKSSKDLVESFGRVDLSKGYAKSLFCTINSFGPNGFGLMLKADREFKSLEESYVKDDIQQPVVSWDVKKLKRKLIDLGNMVIVSALPVDLSGGKAFHYRYVDILSDPDIEVFLELIQDGVITVDHCISKKVGSNVAREQGPLFKIRADSRDSLYRQVQRVDLMDV